MMTKFCALLGLGGLFFCPMVLAGTPSLQAHDLQMQDSVSAASAEAPGSLENTSHAPVSLDIITVYRELFQQTWDQSPDIQIAKKLNDQKAAEEYTAMARRYAPQLDFEVSQTHFLNKDTSTTNALASTAEDASYKDGEDITDWNFDLDIPLYRRTLSLTVSIAEIEYQLAQNNLDIKTQELDAQLHKLLGNYMVATYKLLNLQNSIIISKDHVNKIQRGYELRDQTKLALLRAQANLKELEARKDLNDQRRDTAFRELLDFTAIPDGSSHWIQLQALLISEGQAAACINTFAALGSSTETMEPFLTESSSDAQLRDFFVDNSLLYKKILLERDLSKVKAKKYTQQEWPSLFVRGKYDKKVDSRFSDYYGNGSIGLVLSVPLFSGGTLFSSMKTQGMASDIASLQEFSDVLRTFNSLANKKKTITSLQDIYTKQKIHLEQQQEIVRLSLKSYQIKRTSMQDLLTSKNRLIDAKNLLMQTTADLGILLRQFAWELGTPFPGPTGVH
jgi:outer membrane protein TolC